MKNQALTNKDFCVNDYIGNGKEFSDTSAIGKVWSIGNNDQEFEQIYVETNEDFSWFFKDNYCGIPLTEKWFELFKFKKQIGYYIAVRGELFEDGSISLELGKNDIDTWYVYIRNFNKGEKDDFCILRNDLKYVHELQDIYRFLTKKEFCEEDILNKIVELYEDETI